MFFDKKHYSIRVGWCTTNLVSLRRLRRSSFNLASLTIATLHRFLFKLYNIGITIYLFKLIKNFLLIVISWLKLTPLSPVYDQFNQDSSRFYSFSFTFNITFRYSLLTFYYNSALYADDTAILATHNNFKITLQNSIQKYIKWIQLWRIQINPTKTQAKMFTLCRPTEPPSLIINTINIPWLDNHIPVKYFRITFRPTSHWEITYSNYHEQNLSQNFKIILYL